MKPRHQVSRTAIDLIKRFEGYRQKAAQLPDGRWTIGYGHTLTAREGAQVSEQDAEALLMYDLIAVAHVLNEQIFTPLNQNQFDALACFAFNIGSDAFRRSAVLRRINEGAMIQAACAMELWRKADFEGERIVIDALVRRRAAEKTLFLTPEGDRWVAAPSPLLQPKVDYDASLTIPLQTPTAVTATYREGKARVERDAVQAPAAGVEPERPSASEQAAEGVGARLSAIFADEIPPAPEPAIEPEPRPEFAVEPDVPAEPERRPFLWAPEPANESPAPADEPAPILVPAEHDALDRQAPPVEDASHEPVFALPGVSFFDPRLHDEPDQQAAAALTPEGEDAQVEVAAPHAFDPVEPVAYAEPSPRIVKVDALAASEEEDQGAFSWITPQSRRRRAAKGQGAGLVAPVVAAAVGVGVFAVSQMLAPNAAPDANGSPPLGLMIIWGLGVVGIALIGWGAYRLLLLLAGGEEGSDKA
ncbi:glycoside hydrolase family protein [Caulobacter sp. NIBR2454]|uniref:glycoside hydrolase family protein n=1 Tax=Caulobacter sp. NIBR2454 TaxID=3015996 RepID=UPI0022B6A395|nr:glycoside hydrolase family protein [Caulobacter sp. NIBR2454]